MNLFWADFSYLEPLCASPTTTTCSRTALVYYRTLHLYRSFLMTEILWVKRCFFGFNRLFRYPLKMNNITFLVTKVFYIIKKKLIKSFFLWRKNYQIIFNRKTLANLILNLSLIYRANKIERKDRNEIGQAKLTKLVSNFLQF